MKRKLTLAIATPIKHSARCVQVTSKFRSIQIVSFQVSEDYTWKMASLIITLLVNARYTGLNSLITIYGRSFNYIHFLANGSVFTKVPIRPSSVLVVFL